MLIQSRWLGSSFCCVYLAFLNTVHSLCRRPFKVPPRMCFYQQALCVEIKCNDYFDVHIKIAIVIDLNCALFLLRMNASRNRISRASFPLWNMVAGLGRRQNLHWEWRIEGIVKRFICGRGWRDCKAAEDTSGGSDRCGYFIRFHVSPFKLVVRWNTFDHSFGNVLIQGVHKIYIWFYCMFEILRIAFMCS